jgi:hypothetical protein
VAETENKGEKGQRAVIEDRQKAIQAQEEKLDALVAGRVPESC